MTPQDFIEKWAASELKERSAAQEHFLDLCRLLGEPTPAEADPKGDFYTFERGVTKTGGGDGWADVWRRGCFGWEYKGKKKSLEAAHAQLLTYSVALENPPLLVACDTERFVIKTNWTNTVQEIHEIALEELVDAGKRQILKRVFSDPESLKPLKTRQSLTEEAASTFAALAKDLRARYAPERVAHFVNRLVFCMFAEDIDLLPNKLFEKAVRRSENEPEKLHGYLTRLFAAMKSGGEFGLEDVPWFNGGLFDDDDALELTRPEIRLVLAAAKMDWKDIDPSILGTLFERGLDPDKRSQLGAHYTDRDKIMLILNPVVIEPLMREWEAVRDEIAGLMDRAHAADGRIAAIRAEGGEALKAGGAVSASAEKARQKEVTRQRNLKTRSVNQAEEKHQGFIDRLSAFRVLDPACGSGNFLNLALQALKDLEHRANLDAEALGLPRRAPRVGPETVMGIEINPYAAELARVSIWIGEIQWMRRNGFSESRNPVLRPLGNIECGDALIRQDAETGEWREATWPEADAIVGNPPFLGDKKMIGVLGDTYTATLRSLYSERVPAGANLVVYWFEIAWEQIRAGEATLAGFVATQSIRRGGSSRILKRITGSGRIFDAWEDEGWTVDGAAVRVSLVCFDNASGVAQVNGRAVERINSDLSSEVDLTGATRLGENLHLAFQGPVKVGAFEIEGETARAWLRAPLNPNGRTNIDVLRPWANGMDVTRRPTGRWIIDFAELDESDAATYELPFEYVKENVRPGRLLNRDRQRRTFWWKLGRSGADWKNASTGFRRVIITPRVAKFRLFAWAARSLLPDSRLVAIAREDDTTFGILHSRPHELWSLRLGGWHGVGNDPQYTPSLGFETFPFPEGLTPDIPAAAYADDPRAQAIAQAAARLNELRENWLNPPDLVRREPEVAPGYPDRILPVDAAAEKALKKRTLTNLYNARPAWLDHAHRALDEAVAAAYGWPADLSDDEVLARLFALNQERAAAQ